MRKYVEIGMRVLVFIHNRKCLRFQQFFVCANIDVKYKCGYMYNSIVALCVYVYTYTYTYKVSTAKWDIGRIHKISFR